MASMPDDAKLAQMVNLYGAILASVPTDVQRDRGGPLTEDEIPEAAEYMKRLGAEVRDAREQGDAR